MDCVSHILIFLVPNTAPSFLYVLSRCLLQVGRKEKKGRERGRNEGREGQREREKGGKKGEMEEGRKMEVKNKEEEGRRISVLDLYITQFKFVSRSDKFIQLTVSPTHSFIAI